MHAAVLQCLGKLPRYEQFPDPVARDGEVVVQVLAASLKPVDKQLASGSHFASPREGPVICGTDGIGLLDAGTRVFFGASGRPYGAMAERTLVRREFCFPVPDNLSDEVAAALPNPGVSAWASLDFRAKLVPGESVLILGATGVTGKLAVKIAKLLGAARVVAAGRDQQALRTLPGLGADTTIRLDVSETEVVDAFASAVSSGIHVVIDYVWGRPVELLLSAMTRKEFAANTYETRLVQVGENAGPTISLPAAVLRSSALAILGTAGIPPREVLVDALQKVLAHAAGGDLSIDTEPVPLAEIEKAWQRESKGRRLVIIP